MEQRKELADERHPLPSRVWEPEPDEEDLERMMQEMAAKNGATEELKAKNQMAWVGLMNSLKNQAEELILTELIYA